MAVLLEPVSIMIMQCKSFWTRKTFPSAGGCRTCLMTKSTISRSVMGLEWTWNLSTNNLLRLILETVKHLTKKLLKQNRRQLQQKCSCYQFKTLNIKLISNIGELLLASFKWTLGARLWSSIMASIKSLNIESYLRKTNLSSFTWPNKKPWI